ncbi:element excision factor XisH family protein [[Limnothrix rosea] IAM M-220]|uniref:element excision factor XisH family protein n=1 Tax=[Limnothrix rosea] IAM M-220 TaxID=454133 RepID=UPI002689810C
MAKDLFHDLVKKALENDGWTITDDPLMVKVGDTQLYVDLGLEKLVSAERNGEKIAVEIKSFLNPSAMADFHLALGQYVNYRFALEKSEENRKLYLAVPDIAYEKFFKKEFIKMVIEQHNLNLIVYSTDEEEILKWIG